MNSNFLTDNVGFQTFFYLLELKPMVLKLLSLILEEHISVLEQGTFIQNEIPSQYQGKKAYRGDVVFLYCNTVIDIEMNKHYYDGLINKNTSYLFRILGNQYKVGKTDDYKEKRKAIQINFDNYELYSKDQLITKYSIKNEVNYLETERYQSYHINLLYLKRKCYNKEKLTELEKLLQIFVVEKEDMIMTKETNQVNKILEELKNDPCFSRFYTDEEYQSIKKSIIDYNRKRGKELGIKEGLKEGKELGIKEGLKEGKELGIKEGRRQGKEQGLLIAAKNMLQENIPIEIIERTTGLDINCIQRQQTLTR